MLLKNKELLNADWEEYVHEKGYRTPLFKLNHKQMRNRDSWNADRPTCRWNGVRRDGQRVLANRVEDNLIKK